MTPKEIKNELGNIDIYLFDQILKERFQANDKILDAGCGSGRNLAYFLKNKFDAYGIDSDIKKIETLQKQYSKERLSAAEVENTPFNNNEFDYIICNAVLHFAKNKVHFFDMFTELFRVLKPNGTLFIRMTSNFGIENKVTEILNNVYKIPDGSTRFLLTKSLLEKLETTYKFTFIEPLKTVNVNNLRCMSTLVLKKFPADSADYR
jgi:ubiquinone/menaquinone biosynthesis C-methylase UbiE